MTRLFSRRDRCWLLLWPRLWGDESRQTVIDDELAVVFARVFDEAIGEIGDADLLVGEGVDDEVGHSFIAFGFDGGGAVGESLFHEGNHIGLGFVVSALGIFLGGH